MRLGVRSRVFRSQGVNFLANFFCDSVVVRMTQQLVLRRDWSTHFLVGSRLKLASNRHSRFFDLHREHGPFEVFRASQASLTWRQRVQLFARPVPRKLGVAFNMFLQSYRRAAEQCAIGN